MAVQAWFEPGDTDVTPGSTTMLVLTVVNLGATTDSFAIVPSGLASGWTIVRPGTVTLFGGAQQAVEVEVHPPALATTTSGPTAITVRIVPHAEPDEVVSAEAIVVVARTDRRRVHLLQPVRRARRRTTYEVMVVNDGNAPASCRLQVIDPTERLTGEFDPPAVEVDAGASTLAQLRVRAARRRWRRSGRTIPFTVAAVQHGSDTAEGDGMFVQTPLVGERFWVRLGAIALVAGALVAAWFAVVRPEIRDAADDAVADRAVPGSESAPGTSTVATPGAPDEPGTPGARAGAVFGDRLATTAPTGQTATQAFTVPAGSTLEITDLIVEDPNDDDGTATVLRGDDVLFTWKLRDVFGVQPLQLVTPIQLDGGQALTFSVTCDALGDPAAGSCSQALSVLGRLVPAS